MSEFWRLFQSEEEKERWRKIEADRKQVSERQKKAAEAQKVQTSLARSDSLCWDILDALRRNHPLVKAAPRSNLLMHPPAYYGYDHRSSDKLAVALRWGSKLEPTDAELTLIERLETDPEFHDRYFLAHGGNISFVRSDYHEVGFYYDEIYTKVVCAMGRVSTGHEDVKEFIDNPAIMIPHIHRAMNDPSHETWHYQSRSLFRDRYKVTYEYDPYQERPSR